MTTKNNKKCIAAIGSIISLLNIRCRISSLLILPLLIILALSPSAQTISPRPSYLPYDEAEPILKTLEEILPTDLKGKTSTELARAWPGWVYRRDAEIRARLAQGDEDSLLNLLLFGTSYTKQPRITSKEIAGIRLPESVLAERPSATPASRILQRRIADLILALAAPRNNERVRFARTVLVQQKKHNPSTVAGRAQLRAYLLAAVQRVLNEQATYTQALESARLLDNPTEEFAERSRLYRNRGLSSDTSLLPNFSLEESLKAMLARGLLSPGSVRRIAIIGPGLDFADKQEGYDFYPQQTIQPFAMIDSILRLGLARSGALRVVTFDLSPRVNHHLKAAIERAPKGLSYVVQLPRDTQARWKPEAVRYWEQFGNQIGSPVPPVAIPANVSEVKVRAVRIRPAVVSTLIPVDLNIVLQRLELAPEERFDLVIATNVFVYYDTLEQTLALANVARMLRTGGFLLTNNTLLEFEFLKMRSVDYLTAVYSDRPNDGDHIIWYLRD